MQASRDQVRQWLERLHGTSSGMLHVCGTGSWTGRRFDLARTGIHEAAGYVMERDATGQQGIYLRATTLRYDAPADSGARAGAAHSMSLPGLWADIDIAGPGHKHRSNRPDLPGYDPTKMIVHPLPANEEAAEAIVEEAGLLKPTLWVHSGGGLYPWWLLDESVQLLDGEMLTAATNLSEGWQRLLVGAAERLGTAYGNVGDLARVLRIPGTINRKDGLERPCRVLDEDGPVYTFNDLVECWASIQDELDATAAAEAAARPAPVAATTIPAPPPATSPVDPAGSPLNAFEAVTSWQQILEPHGWEVHHLAGATTYWTRPGKHRSEGHSATTGHSTDGHDRMWVFSTEAGLPSGEPMRKVYVWGLLNGFGRDMKAVAKELVRMGFGIPKSSSPAGSPLITLTPVARPAAPPPAVLQLPGSPPAPAAAPVPAFAPPQPAADAMPWHPAPTLPGEGVPLPAFPVHMLPPAMRDLVTNIAGNRQVDATMPALFALSTLSAMAAGKMRVWRNGDWHEALSLYTCSVAGSGERKSPTARGVFGAVDRVERRMFTEHQAAVDALIDELDVERKAAGSNPAAANRVEEKIAAAEASRRRPPRIKLADDITPEAMVHSLGLMGGHGAVLDAEGTFFATLSGRYSKGSPNPDLVIKAYDGDPYTVDRISRDPDRINRPTLALGLAVQEVVLTDAMNSKVLVERGAMARIIYGFPVSQVGRRLENTALPYDPNPGRMWQLVIDGIAEIPAPTDPDNIPTLALSPQALALHIALSDSIEVRLGPGGDLTAAGMKEWCHKHAGRVLRIAALLHLAAGFTTTSEIQPGAMQAAIAIGDWAIEHARRAHRVDRESIEEATVRQCQQVLEWLCRTRPEHVTVREASRGIRAQWVSTKSMEDALDQLVELGWMREEMYLDRASRPRRRYRVSPYIANACGTATM